MRKSAAALFMWFALTGWAEAQQRGEQNPPAPLPPCRENPALRQCQPCRQPGAEMRVTISGRIVADGLPTAGQDD